jgi:hypothetical protein
MFQTGWFLYHQVFTPLDDIQNDLLSVSFSLKGIEFIKFYNLLNPFNAENLLDTVVPKNNI